MSAVTDSIGELFEENRRLRENVRELEDKLFWLRDGKMDCNCCCRDLGFIVDGSTRCRRPECRAPEVTSDGE